LKTAFLFALTLAACQVPAPSYVKPADAADGTFKVEILHNGESLGTGTAWVYDRNDSRSLLVTAGHVCAGDAYKLIDANGAEIPAVEVKRSGDYDLCLLATDSPVGVALPIAPRDVELYERVQYVGAPLGVYGCSDQYSGEKCGYRPYYSGVYAGGDLITAPGYGGSSGSAVFTHEGVIGVLVAGYRQFPHLVFIESRAHLLEFLAGQTAK